MIKKIIKIQDIKISHMGTFNLVDASYLGEGEEGLALDVALNLVDASYLRER